MIAMNSAFAVLGDGTRPVSEDCFTEADAQALAQNMESSFESLLGQSRRNMSEGLTKIGSSVQSSIDSLLTLCGSLHASVGAQRFSNSASRLLEFAPSITSSSTGERIEDDAMHVFEVGGIDAHGEINKLIGSWRKNDRPEVIGENLASFFEDFSEEASEDGSLQQEDHEAQIPSMSMILRDSFKAVIDDASMEVDTSCFSDPEASAFEASVNAALEHIMKKRKDAMQLGLRELSDAINRLMQSLSSDCSSSESARVVWKAAQKLQKLTSQTVADYDTHIQYEAMKSLSVGGVDIHREINAFIVAWSLGNKQESGRPLGLMLRKLSEIVGHDEM
jgi:hypothetical protein